MNGTNKIEPVECKSKTWPFEIIKYPEHAGGITDISIFVYTPYGVTIHRASVVNIVLSGNPGAEASILEEAQRVANFAVEVAGRDPLIQTYYRRMNKRLNKMVCRPWDFDNEEAA